MVRKPALSKSAFIRGKQCHKSLYLIKKFPELRDPVSEQQQAIFSRGHSVGELAQQLFEGGQMAAFDLPQGFMQSIFRTRKLIEGGHQILYEAGFMFQNTHCFVDILVKENGKWHIHEVKSSTGISETYLLDAAFQYYVLQGLGLEIGGVSIIHINNLYVRMGELDLKQLFTVEPVFLQVLDLQPEVHRILEDEVKMLQGDEVPLIPIGPHCNDPYPCDFTGHCWQGLPDYSVFDISRLKTDKKFELYEQGITRPHDVPQDYPLSENQRLQVAADKSGEPIIKHQGIHAFINTLEYPLYFLDFETFNPAIPLFDNSRPYQQVVFQYSLHILESPGGELLHSEFLGNPTEDPRPDMISKLLSETGESGHILVYNQGFETGRLHELADDFPEYEKKIEAMLSRIVDLMEPFQQKLYYTPAMQGSYSIKKVLPALVPGFSYSGLPINNGGDASLAYEGILSESSPAIIKKTRKDLLAYCKLDTLAMVEILKFLQQI